MSPVKTDLLGRLSQTITRCCSSHIRGEQLKDQENDQAVWTLSRAPAVERRLRPLAYRP